LQELTKIGQLKTGKIFAWFDESLVFAQANFQIKFFQCPCSNESYLKYVAYNKNDNGYVMFMFGQYF